VSQLTRINPDSFDAVKLVQDLMSRSKTEIVRRKLELILARNAEEAADMKVILELVEPNQFGRQFQIRSSEALACALWSLLR
jgi:nitrogen fixation protein FixH